MQWHRRICLRVALTVITLIGVLASSAVWSQTGRATRLILPFPPGGPADVMARMTAQQIGAAGGPSMVVESRPGAGSEIGTEYVSRAAPDGNTLLIMSPSFVVLPHVRKLIRSIDGFRADLRTRDLSAAHRRQWGLALPHAQ